MSAFSSARPDSSVKPIIGNMKPSVDMMPPSEDKRMPKSVDTAGSKHPVSTDDNKRLKTCEENKRKQPSEDVKKQPPTSNLEPEDKPDSRFGLTPMLNNMENATNVSDRSTAVNILPEQKEDYVKADPQGTIKLFTNHLFVRDGVFPAKNRTLQSYCVDKYTKIDQSMLMGEFFNYDDSGFWRVMGMRPARTIGPCIEYDVFRLRHKVTKSPRETNTANKASKYEGTEHVMRLCDSDSPNDHLLFLQPFVFLRDFHEAFQGHPQHYRFSALLGSGAFDQLCYKDNSTDDDLAKLFMLFPRPHARPYFIVEKQGPSIEDLLKANQFGILDVSTARFIAIGCIQTLRLMHEMGYVHRCVTSYTFGIRITKDGFLYNAELAKNVVCRDPGFVRRFRSVNNPPRRVAPFAGTYKYSSINAMDNKEQLPSDDLVSVLYLFVEMVHGKLPWRPTRNVTKIRNLKQQLQVDPPVVVDNTGAKKFAIDLRYLPRAFKLLENFNPFSRESYTVYRDICTVLNLIAESNRHTLTEDYIELNKPKVVQV